MVLWHTKIWIGPHRLRRRERANRTIGCGPDWFGEAAGGAAAMDVLGGGAIKIEL